MLKAKNVQITEQKEKIEEQHEDLKQALARVDEAYSELKAAQKQMLQDNPRWRLACKAIVGYGMKEGEMTIRVNGKRVVLIPGETVTA